MWETPWGGGGGSGNFGIATMPRVKSDSKYTVWRDFAVGGCAKFQIFRIYDSFWTLHAWFWKIFCFLLKFLLKKCYKDRFPVQLSFCIWQIRADWRFGRGYFARLIGILIEAIVSLQLYKSEANRADPRYILVHSGDILDVASSRRLMHVKTWIMHAVIQ